MKKLCLGLFAFSLFSQAFAQANCNVWVNNQLPTLETAQQDITFELHQLLKHKGYTLSGKDDSQIWLDLSTNDKKNRILVQLIEHKSNAHDRLILQDDVADKGSKILEKSEKKLEELRELRPRTPEEYYWLELDYDELREKTHIKFTEARLKEVNKLLSKLPYCN